MKDVENLFKRLGTNSEYKDFGTKVIDDVRQKWPLLENVSESEKARMGSPLKASAEAAHAAVHSAEKLASPSNPVKPTLPEPESKLPVRSFLSKKRPAQESAREIFKSIGKSPRLKPPGEEESAPKAKTLFGGNKLKSGKKI